MWTKPLLKPSAVSLYQLSCHMMIIPICEEICWRTSSGHSDDSEWEANRYRLGGTGSTSIPSTVFESESLILDGRKIRDF